jgi:hypothetical protein
MSIANSGRLPEIISTLKLLKNVVALAPLGEHVGAGIELAISICEMAQVRYITNILKCSLTNVVVIPERESQPDGVRRARTSDRCATSGHLERGSKSISRSLVECEVEHSGRHKVCVAKNDMHASKPKFAIIYRVLTDARDVVRTQTARSIKSSKSILRALKGPRAEKDVEEMAALEAKISAALERFQV